MLATAAASPSPFWYLTRGTGVVTLVLLTAAVVLDVANVQRLRPSGPLAAGWARRAGTPPALLARSGSTTTTSSFTATARGTITHATSAGGLAVVELTLRLVGQRLDDLRVRIVGQPIAGGGVDMISSRVLFGPSTNPGQYRGAVTALEGDSMRALVRDASGASLALAIALGGGEDAATSAKISVSPVHG